MANDTTILGIVILISFNLGCPRSLLIGETMNLTHTDYMRQAIEFAKDANPIWPFAALIVDERGNILCKASDCAHISPLFHAEALAIHALIKENKSKNLGRLSLYATAEPDVLSQSVIYWGKIAHDLNIYHIYYGAPLKIIQKLWSFGIDISAEEVLHRSHQPQAQIFGPLLEKECEELFLNAKKKQNEIHHPHPARGQLSHHEKDFYWINSHISLSL